MPLTPEDVSNKRFTTVRLREGYDMTEVDQFLDEVEAELARITQENAELRSKLETAQDGLPASEPATAAVGAEGIDERPSDRASVEQPGDVSAEEAAAPDLPEAAEPVDLGVTAPRLEPEPTAPRVPSVETLQVTTTAEASVAAARLLELAGRNVDQLVGEAREEADQIVAAARADAEEVEAEARRRAEALDAETSERRQSVFGDIEEQKVRLDSEIDNLRVFEREYRAELRTYFEEQLAALDGHGSGGALVRSEREGEPRLQELLGAPPAEQQDQHEQHHG